MSVFSRKVKSELFNDLGIRTELIRWSSSPEIKGGLPQRNVATISINPLLGIWTGTSIKRTLRFQEGHSRPQTPIVQELFKDAISQPAPYKIEQRETNDLSEFLNESLLEPKKSRQKLSQQKVRESLPDVFHPSAPLELIADPVAHEESSETHSQHQQHHQHPQQQQQGHISAEATNHADDVVYEPESDTEQQMEGDYQIVHPHEHEPVVHDRVGVCSSILGRRGRPSTRDDRSRNWLCGCGKLYLTYGALYSHTRVKHAGVQPPGSVRLRQKDRKPRKDIGIVRSIRTEKGGNKRLHTKLVKHNWEVDFIEFLNCLISARDQIYESHWQGYKEYLQSVIVQSSSEDNRLFPEFYTLVAFTYWLSEEAIDIFGESLFRRDSISLLQLMAEANPMGNLELETDPTHGEPLARVNLLTGLSVFLLAVSRFTSISLFKEILLLLARVGRAANLRGAIYELNLRHRRVSEDSLDPKSFTEDFLESGAVPLSQEYWQTHSAERTPEILLGYLLESFPSDVEPSAMYLHEKESVFPNIFGVEEVNLVRAITLFSLFCRWLLGHGLVPSSFTVENCPKIYTPFLQDHTKPGLN